MKKILLLFLIISTNFYSQNKAGNDIFRMEFIRIMANLEENSNDYYTDLVERSMFSIKDSLKYGFINHKGKEVFEENYSYASDFFNGKSNIIIDSISGILFKDGTKKMFPEYNATFWYKGNLGIVIKDGKYGFINKNGKVIIQLIYEDAFPFYQGYASVKANDKWNYVNENGLKMFPDSLIFGYRPIINSKAIFMIENNKVERNKSMITENGSRTFVEFLNKTGQIQLKEGLIDVNGTIIINPKFDEISGYFQNGYMRVRNNGKTGIINEKGEIIIPIEYDDISDFENGLFLANKANKSGMINSKNQVIIQFAYSKIRHFKDDLALIIQNGKTGYININNEIVIKPEYDFNLSGDFYNGLATVRSNGKNGYINKNNEIVIPIIYDNALPFKEKETMVQKDGFTFKINSKGEKIKNISKPYLWIERDGLIRFAK